MKGLYLLLITTLLYGVDAEIAIVKSLNGTVLVKHKPKRQEMRIGDTVDEGDTLMRRSSDKVSYMFHHGKLIAPDPKGELLIERVSKPLPLHVGDALYEDDVVITKKESSVGILFEDDALLSLGSGSMIRLDKYLFGAKKGDNAFVLDFQKGTAAFESGKIGKKDPEAFEFKVPEGTIAIRGTKFCVKVEGE